MEQLLNEIAELEKQENGLRTQLEQTMTLDSKERMASKLNVVTSQLNEKREALNKQQREAEVEEKVNSEPVPFSILGIDLNGMPVEFVELVEGVYRTTLRNALNEHAIELEQLEEVSKKQLQEIDEAWASVNRVNKENDGMLEVIENLRLQFQNEHEMRQDAEAKRDAAVREKEENYMAMDAEIQGRQNYINELKAKIAEYEQAEEYRQRQEQPLAVSAEESTSLQEKADAVKKLFRSVEDWGSIMKVTRDDGEIELVKRAELSDWEALDVPETDEVVEEPFRETIPAPELQDAAVREHTTDGEVDADATEVDGETFEQEVRRRLDRLEVSLLKAVA